MALKPFRCQIYDKKDQTLWNKIVITAPSEDALNEVFNDFSDGTPAECIRELLTAAVPGVSGIRILQEDRANSDDVVLTWQFIHLNVPC